MSDPSASHPGRRLSQSAQSARSAQSTHSAGSASGDLASKTSKAQATDRPISLREDSSKSARSQSSLGTTEASSTNRQTLTPRTPFTPTSTTISVPPQPQSSRFRVPASPRSANMPLGESSKAAKVAIPRLKRSLEAGEVNTKPGGRHRVTHACEPCRHRKTKCSGERPTCRHCQDFKIQCYYADGKRDRVKKYAIWISLFTSTDQAQAIWEYV